MTLAYTQENNMLNYTALEPATPWIVAKPTSMGIIITDRGFTKNISEVKAAPHDGVLLIDPCDKELEHLLYQYNTQLSNLNKRK